MSTLEIQAGDVLIMGGVEFENAKHLEALLRQHLGTDFRIIVLTSAAHGPTILRRARKAACR